MAKYLYIAQKTVAHFQVAGQNNLQSQNNLQAEQDMPCYVTDTKKNAMRFA